MDILKDLSPEQIKALSPECLQILLNQDKRTNGIADLKHCFLSIKCDSDGGPKIDNSNITRIQQLLLKNINQTFYLTYVPRAGGYSGNSPTDWNIHTEDEIKTMILTGVELENICIYKGNFPLEEKYYNDYVVPRLYHEKDKSNEIKSIQQLIHYHDNLKIVHAHLLRCAQHFYS